MSIIEKIERIEKIKGGTEPSANPSWCAGHLSQCMDIYNHNGGDTNNNLTNYKKKYNKYRNKINNLILLNSNIQYNE